MQINQTALTRKYQANYFEDQLYLVKKFDDMVRKNIKPSKQERIYLAEYMIAKTIQSICRNRKGQIKLTLYHQSLQKFLPAPPKTIKVQWQPAEPITKVVLNNHF